MCVPIKSTHASPELTCLTDEFSFYFLHSLGTKGRNKGEFTNLQGVAASSNGKILIADSNNQCVQVRHILSSPPSRNIF